MGVLGLIMPFYIFLGAGQEQATAGAPGTTRVKHHVYLRVKKVDSAVTRIDGGRICLALQQGIAASES